MIWENVQVYNCSQKNTENAAVRFENARGREDNRIQDSVIHNGLGWGLHVKDSKRIQVSGNTIAGFRALGAKASSVDDFTFNDNMVFDVIRREDFGTEDMIVDVEACVSICAHPVGN